MWTGVARGSGGGGGVLGQSRAQEAKVEMFLAAGSNYVKVMRDTIPVHTKHFTDKASRLTAAPKSHFACVLLFWCTFTLGHKP